MQDTRFCPRAFQLRSPPILFQFRFCAYQRLTQTQTLQPCCQRVETKTDIQREEVSEHL